MNCNAAPKVSIIIPFYKNLTYLEECVKHCLDLDYPCYEILVVSNSNITLTPEQVKIIVTDCISQGHKKNVGVANAAGEICAFIDDDAYPRNDWIKNVIKYFEDPNVVAVGGPGITPPNDSLMQTAGGLIYSLPIGSGNFSGRYTAKKTDNIGELPGYNLFVRKSFLKEIGGVNVEYRSGEDSILSHRIVKVGKKFRYAEDVVVYHHRRPLFRSHLKQVSTYALHRGYFTKKHPETSAKPSYLLPSTLLITTVIWALLALLIPVFLIPLIVLIAGYLALCFMLALIKSKDLKLSSLVCIGIPLTHLVYAVYFIKGILTKELGDRPSY
jgi:cellulose synthase/poly-beta-1,6-N-acetylglucosamine synthase-like glycosyltransferase